MSVMSLQFTRSLPWRRLKEARQCLERSKREHAKVAELSQELRARRDANHFAQMVAAALRGTKDGS